MATPETIIVARGRSGIHRTSGTPATRGAPYRASITASSTITG